MRGDWVRRNDIELVQKKMIKGTTSWTGATLCEGETVGLCGNEAIIFSSLGRTQASRRSLHQRRRVSHQQPLVTGGAFMSLWPLT